MEHTDKLKQPHEIIREAMKREGIDYATIAQRIGEARVDKLSVAVRCTTGVGPRAIEIRKKVAHALNLDPEKVWDKIYLQERTREASGYSKAKPADLISGEEWAAMTPSARVRSLLRQHDMTIQHLAEMYGVTYRVMTNNIYGATVNHEIRKDVAKQFGRDPAEIWDNLYGKTAEVSEQSLSEVLAENPNFETFLGFGDLTKHASPACENS